MSERRYAERGNHGGDWGPLAARGCRGRDSGGEASSEVIRLATKDQAVQLDGARHFFPDEQLWRAVLGAAADHYYGLIEWSEAITPAGSLRRLALIARRKECLRQLELLT